MQLLAFKKWGFLLCLLGVSPLWGASFTSADNIFTLDLPAGWKQISAEGTQNVLSLQKNNATIDIRQIACTTEDCLEDKIHEDLAKVKAKKMTVITNTYTGEEIKKIEFSTGEPLYYISFFTPKSDFSSGYFLMNERAYSVLAKNITYAEADLLFSFFSPVKQAEPTISPTTQTIEMDISSNRAYDIAALPQVEETVLEEVSPEGNTAQTAQAPAKPSLLQRVHQKTNALKQALKQALHPWKPRSLVSSKMPPYIRQMGRLFDTIFLLFVGFIILWLVALAVRLLRGAKTDVHPVNPHSLYPILITRLYGTPALIFRAKDNQGNILVSLGNRWHSICAFMGICAIFCSVFLLAAVSLLEQTKWITLSLFKGHIIYSASAMFLPVGILLVAAGIMWGFFARHKFAIFDHKGEKAAMAIQRGFDWREEHYEIYFVRSKDTLQATRKRFSWLRQWTLKDKEGNVLAEVAETHLGRAIARKLLGHLWGFLRTDYALKGPMDSQGVLANQHAIFNKLKCNINKPEALSARDGLMLSVLISMRDMDKWYPWFE